MTRFYKPWEVLLKFWRIELGQQHIRLFTSFFALEIYDRAPASYLDILVSGVHLVWGFTWESGIEEGQIMFKHERWFRRVEHVSLWGYHVNG